MRYLALSICALGCTCSGIGLGVINKQITSCFQELKQDTFVKENNQVTQGPNFNAWNLIYSSGSISYLRQLIDQIQIGSDLGLKQVDTDSGAMTISSTAYLPRLKNLLNSFFKDLNWETLIANHEKVSPPSDQNQTQSISTSFYPFKTKFFSFSNWVELGVIVLVIEAIFLLFLIVSIALISLDWKLKRAEKIKWILYYLFTNLLGWVYLNYLKNKSGKKAWIPKRTRKDNDYQLLDYSGNKSAIVLSDVCFSQDDYKILKGINLALQRNEFYAIIGPNGAGKTTLLKNIGGILKSSSGKVEMGGTNLLSIPKNHSGKRLSIFLKS